MEKQIEDMQKDIMENTAIYDSDVAQDVAETLTYKGYRKHVEGEWLPTCDNHPLVNKYKCSICGDENMRGNFCPNCGAKMKGGN